jgi:hypothetical protein
MCRAIPLRPPLCLHSMLGEIFVFKMLDEKTVLVEVLCVFCPYKQMSVLLFPYINSIDVMVLTTTQAPLLVGS